MSTYMFRTTATMKPHNSRNWYIDPDIIRTKYIGADNLREALQAYADDVTNTDYITISHNAMRTKLPMYRDGSDGQPRQVGYVITARTEFQRENGTFCVQPIDLWISINRIEAVDFEEVSA